MRYAWESQNYTFLKASLLAALLEAKIFHRAELGSTFPLVLWRMRQGRPPERWKLPTPSSAGISTGCLPHSGQALNPTQSTLASPTMEKLQAEWLCFEGSLYSQSLLLKPHPGTDRSRTQTPELYSKGPCSASGQFWSWVGSCLGVTSFTYTLIPLASKLQRRCCGSWTLLVGGVGNAWDGFLTHWLTGWSWP